MEAHLGQHGTPTLNSGDTEALIAASRLGRARFLELIDKYGYDTVFAAGEYWLDYSERKLRAEIGRAPDGSTGRPHSGSTTTASISGSRCESRSRSRSRATS